MSLAKDRARPLLGFAHRDERGLTLVETLAAILLLAFMMGALISITMTGYGAIRTTRFTQQGTAMGNEALEEARDFSYDALVHERDADFNSDPLIASCGAYADAYDPDGAGPLACEPMVSAASTAFDDHIRSENVDGKMFTVSRYVTWVDATNQGGSTRDYKRVSVVVTWQGNPGPLRSFTASTFVARARRGLPAPRFTMTPPDRTVQVQAEAGFNYAYFPYVIQNQGIPDTIDLVACTGTPASLDPPTCPLLPSGWSAQFFHDQGTVGAYEEGVDTLLTNTNGTAGVDTGHMDTGATLPIIVRIQMPTGQPTSSTNLTIRGTASADTSVTREVRSTVEPGGLRLYLHNSKTDASPQPAPTGHTNDTTYNFMNTNPSTGTTLYRYTANLYSATDGSGAAIGGHAIEVYPNDSITPIGGTSGSFNTANYSANWIRKVGTGGLITGTATLDLWVAQKDLKCDKTMTFRAFLLEKAASNQTTLSETLASATASRAASGESSCAYQKITMTFALNNTVAQDSYLELRVFVDKSSGEMGLVAYDTTGFESSLKLPSSTL